MAKISLNDAGKFASQSSNDYFTLENDGDTARVRFLYDDPNGEDVDYYLVHEVQIGDRKRYVACRAITDEGKLDTDLCPLCQAGYKRVEKLFLQLYNEDTDKVETWERGRTFVAKISTYINRYKQLVKYPIDIERHGKKGDQKTTYELFPLEPDESTLEDFPEKSNLLGTLIIDASEEDMDEIINGTYNPPGSNDNNSQQESTTRTRNRNQSSTRKNSSSAKPTSNKTASGPRRSRKGNTNTDAF